MKELLGKVIRDIYVGEGNYPLTFFTDSAQHYSYWGLCVHPHVSSCREIIYPDNIINQKIIGVEKILVPRDSDRLKSIHCGPDYELHFLYDYVLHTQKGATKIVWDTISTPPMWGDCELIPNTHLLIDEDKSVEELLMKKENMILRIGDHDSIQIMNHVISRCFTISSLCKKVN